MIRYVVGLLLDNKGNIALIQKNRPEWQRGLLNGIGGHIENNETPKQAMIREFKEEAGFTYLNWRRFCLMKGDNYKLYYFVNYGTKIKSMTDEIVNWYSLKNLPTNLVPPLQWIIPMAYYQYERLNAIVIHKKSTC